MAAGLLLFPGSNPVLFHSFLHKTVVKLYVEEFYYPFKTGAIQPRLCWNLLCSQGDLELLTLLSVKIRSQATIPSLCHVRVQAQSFVQLGKCYSANPATYPALGRRDF